LKAAPRSINECEKIQAADAYNQCLALFGPVARGHGVARDSGDTTGSQDEGAVEGPIARSWPLLPMRSWTTAMAATTRTSTAGGDIGGLVMAGLIMAERAIAGRTWPLAPHNNDGSPAWQKNYAGVHTVSGRAHLR